MMGDEGLLFYHVMTDFFMYYFYLRLHHVSVEPGHMRNTFLFSAHCCILYDALRDCDVKYSSVAFQKSD